MTTLNRRKKWHKEKTDLKFCDQALVLEKDVDEGPTILSRVLEVFPGSDGHIRVLKINTSYWEVIRNITKMFHLELSE